MCKNQYNMVYAPTKCYYSRCYNSVDEDPLEWAEYKIYIFL